MIWLAALSLLCIGLVVLVLVGVALMLPAASEAAERVRIRHEAEDAAWDIHTRAIAAFGEMLRTARSSEMDDGSTDERGRR